MTTIKISHEELIQENGVLKQKLEKAVDGLIFYSNLAKYEDTHEQLDWSLVNNPAVIQDRGKFAREVLKEVDG